MQNATQTTAHELCTDMHRYKSVYHKHNNVFVLSQHFSNNYYFKIQKTSAFSGLYAPFASYLQRLGDGHEAGGMFCRSYTIKYPCTNLRLTLA